MLLHFFKRVVGVKQVAHAEKQVTEVELFRLSSDQFSSLRDALPKPGVARDQLEAGYLLGVQATLEVLRKGWVIGE